ncbi:MAG: CoA transferase [Actinomycetota bacterium]|jgi:CoA:oxalate CoA-transferase|nr:CoA transferase [Actinomycetota bacterium]
MATANPDPTELLAGVRVLDLTQYLAGPTCTRLLVELGAEVWKVEFPPAGDPTRAVPPTLEDISSAYIQQNRGKQSLCLDLRHEQAPDLIRRLAREVDVVVENFTPGVLAKRGLAYKDLSAINPRIIMASVSGFGQDNSYSHRNCFDFIAQGMAGVMYMTGEPDGPPYFAGIGAGDVTAGVHAFAGVGFALYQRDRTGLGTHIDVSMVDALFHMQEYAVGAASMGAGDYAPNRQGRHYAPGSPAGTFRAPKGWVVIIALDNQIKGLWEAMGDPTLADDPRFATLADRIANREPLTELIEAWMSGFDEDEEVLAVLERHRVPAGPVLSPAAAIDHPWFQETGTVRQVSDSHGGEFTIPGFPIRYDGTKPEADLHSAALGEHTNQILTEAGLADEEIASLVDEGVVRLRAGAGD